MSLPNYSRNELIGWVNSLLQLQITKIESCGSGAVYCQILDSIYYDVPMNKVNFEAKTVAQYIANFKVLQDCFKRHSITQIVDVSELVKCKMMANLNFLQWMRHFWEANHTTVDYDAVNRRASRGGSAAEVSHNAGSAYSAGPTGPRQRLPLNARSDAMINSIQKQKDELQEMLAGAEKERDFYYNKLREIEVLLLKRQEQKMEEQEPAETFVQEVHDILYTTADGFEIPPQDGVEEDDFGAQPHELVEETF